MSAVKMGYSGVKVNDLPSGTLHLKTRGRSTTKKQRRLKAINHFGKQRISVTTAHNVPTFKYHPNITYIHIHAYIKRRGGGSFDMVR